MEQFFIAIAPRSNYSLRNRVGVRVVGIGIRVAGSELESGSWGLIRGLESKLAVSESEIIIGLLDSVKIECILFISLSVGECDRRSSLV